MATAKKICRVCGKEYEACRTPNPSGMFRWRDVACSVECGAEYLRRVNESRGIVEKDEKPEEVVLNVSEANDMVSFKQPTYILDSAVDDGYMPFFTEPN